MKQISTYLLVTAMLLLNACSPKHFSSPDQLPALTNVDPTLIATLYAQRAAECKALYYQAYNIAREKLDATLAARQQTAQTQQTPLKPMAIVVDIDETILDNTPWQAEVIQRNTAYPHYWEEWEQLGIAKPLPGALEFLQYASQKGCTIFYISNRLTTCVPATLRNLQETGFPNPESQYLLFKEKGKTSSKTERRNQVLKDYEIVLYCGDNLCDFPEAAFESEDEATRDMAVRNLQAAFGSKWIILPNPIYGKWLDVLLKSTPTDKPQSTHLRTLLKGYK